MDFYYPQNKYSDKWLDKRYFRDGEKIAKNYKKLDLEYSSKKCLIVDSSLLHQSVTKKGCKARLSMDIGIIPYKYKVINYRNHTNHIPFEEINKIGNDKFMIYKDSIFKKIKKTKVGTNTQANRKILSLGHNE